MLLTEEERSQPQFAGYLKNYEQIAADDLNTPILDLEYVRRQAANLARAAGDVRGLDVLDLGCGQGFLTRSLVGGGAESVVAVDISSAYLRRLAGTPRVTPVLVNAERLPFVSSFDLVVSTDVMEHVLNIGSFLVSVNDALRPRGRVVIRVPYRENLIPYAQQAGCKYELVHLRAFDRTVLHDALTSAGFEIERTWLDGFSLYTPQQFWLAGPRRKALYVKLQQWILTKLQHPSAVTNWPWLLASVFMRPTEIVVSARKARPAIERNRG
jgi:SAM-dependent methyltransferase